MSPAGPQDGRTGFIATFETFFRGGGARHLHESNTVSTFVLFLDLETLRHEAGISAKEMNESLESCPYEALSCVGIAACQVPAAAPCSRNQPHSCPSQVLKQQIEDSLSLGRKINVRVRNFEPQTPIRHIKSSCIGACKVPALSSCSLECSLACGANILPPCLREIHRDPWHSGSCHHGATARHQDGFPVPRQQEQALRRKADDALRRWKIHPAREVYCQGMPLGQLSARSLQRPDCRLPAAAVRPSPLRTQRCYALLPENASVPCSLWPRELQIGAGFKNLQTMLQRQVASLARANANCVKTWSTAASRAMWCAAPCHCCRLT